jgi:uncharacterized membrane protein YphA (DoxX/SURF4 family)
MDSVTAILNSIFARRVSVHLYGLGAVALALVSLSWGGRGVLGPSTLGYVAAVLFLLAGLALQWESAVARGALALTVLYAAAVAAVDIPAGAAHANVFVSWFGAAEHLALAASALIILANYGSMTPATAKRLSLIGRVVFGLCLVYFGVAHFVYFTYTAKMVPAWLPPSQGFWTYATAAGHIAAGIAILTGIAARPAAMLLAAMFIIFGILVHAPTLFEDPHRYFYWIENSMNFALIGCAWIFAAYASSAISPPPA